MAATSRSAESRPVPAPAAAVASAIDRIKPYLQSARPYLEAGYSRIRDVFSRPVVTTAKLPPSYRRLVGSIMSERDDNALELFDLLRFLY